MNECLITKYYILTCRAAVEACPDDDVKYSNIKEYIGKSRLGNILIILFLLLFFLFWLLAHQPSCTIVGVKKVKLITSNYSNAVYFEPISWLITNYLTDELEENSIISLIRFSFKINSDITYFKYHIFLIDIKNASAFTQFIQTYFRILYRFREIRKNLEKISIFSKMFFLKKCSF